MITQSPAIANLSWVLDQAGARITAERLIRVMAFNSVLVVPWNTPHAAMVEASMHAIDGMGLLSKREKHTIRLEAALSAGKSALMNELEQSA
jgi:hypothetical protein